MLVYDFEVFRYDWLVVIVDITKEKDYLFVNDAEGLRSFYKEHINDIWCGFNSRNYDTYILKSILAGYNPYKMSEHIIKGGKGWEFDREMLKFQLFDFDVRPTQVSPGLKTYEAFMGDDIRESSVPFNIDRKLTEEELQETIKYCRHDVKETIKVMSRLKDEFYAHFGLIKEFDLPLSCISKTKAQLSAIILNCERKERDDEWEFGLEQIIDVNKYTEVVDWFKDPANRNLDKDNKLNIEISGMPTTFGMGGCHGALKNYREKGKFLNVDVASYYPSLMIEWNMLSRNSKTPEKFKEIYEKRLALKAAGKKKEQAPLKIVLNGTFGASADKYNALYDPRQAHRICITGQLLLLDLMEKLENKCVLVQCNTDGILVKLTDENEEEVISICKDWENRTRMKLEFDYFDEVIERDVNNYVIVYTGKDGKKHYKSKGAVVKSLSVLDYDLPIVNKAVLAWFVDGVPPEKTVYDCDNFIDFQKIYKLSSLYNNAMLGCTFRDDYVIGPTGRKNKVKVWNEDGVKLTDKTYRVYASKEKSGALYKKKNGKNPEKFASCPDNCFIYNESVVDKKCSDFKELDKDWYVKESWDRINHFMGTR